MLKAPRSLLALLVGLLMMTACSSPRETGDEEAPRRSRSQRTEHPRTDLNLRTPIDDVQTIQLYAEEEDQLPILSMRGGQKLTLEFDLMEGTGRPLSAYFYHATRDWERDLNASEYLTSFHRDDLFDYQLSRNTQVDYTHYAYTFPNSSIDFRISGNFIVRVTEQGREDEVLFERPFFVTENAAAVQFGLESVMVGRQAFPSIQPILSFTPPAALLGNVFDYNVCFIRNGQVDRSRCSDKPSLTQQPDLLFYLEPEDAFAPQEGDYYVDLSNLNIGRRVEATDRSVTPFQVRLDPDYARFPSSGFEPLLNGQAVISDADRFVGDADTEGEYTRVLFRYVPPDEVPLSGGIFITGSFNGWGFDLTNELIWNANSKLYETDLLIKQGRYEYRYTSPDPAVRRQLQVRLPRPDNLYTAFVYFSDVSLNTDRLLAFQHVLSR